MESWKWNMKYHSTSYVLNWFSEEGYNIFRFFFCRCHWFVDKETQNCSWTSLASFTVSSSLLTGIVICMYCFLFSLWQKVLKAPSGFTSVLGPWPEVKTHKGTIFHWSAGCLYIIDTFLTFKPLNPVVRISVVHAHIAVLCYHKIVYVFWWNTFRSKKSDYVMVFN
jgi:hypothetical protein